MGRHRSQFMANLPRWLGVDWSANSLSFSECNNQDKCNEDDSENTPDITSFPSFSRFNTTDKPKPKTNNLKDKCGQ